MRTAGRRSVSPPLRAISGAAKHFETTANLFAASAKHFETTTKQLAASSRMAAHSGLHFAAN
eukprot:1677587-Heterocapsa_arctica.AAC.1